VNLTESLAVGDRYDRVQFGRPHRALVALVVAGLDEGPARHAYPCHWRRDVAHRALVGRSCFVNRKLSHDGSLKRSGLPHECHVVGVQSFEVLDNFASAVDDVDPRPLLVVLGPLVVEKRSHKKHRTTVP
jgi:hypothetical protein